MQKTNKHYVSDIDIKLAEFDLINPQSASQQAEVAKYKRIYRLRDKKAPLQQDNNQIWEKF